MLILVLSTHRESVYALRVIAAGARGYIEKHSSSTEIMAAIHTVLNGHVCLSPEMELKVVDGLASSRPTGAPIAKLSDRELQVVELIGKGYGTKMLASELHLSVKTIETYRARIKEKLGLQSGAELTRYALQMEGICPPAD